MPKRKHEISLEEQQKIRDEAAAAREFLEEDRFAFIRELLLNAQKYAEESIVNNTIREVQEIVPITEKLTKVFKLTKKVQVDELSGQYKLVKKFFSDVRYFVAIEEDLDKEVAEGKVILEKP